ncbi:MAG: AAA family ATPase [Betaproteobacteria bacterium]|nr:AAA family ATPase [Betaproteobacteria bacterium]
MKDKITASPLRDSPSNTDEFGIHQRIADAIASFIENEKGGLAISLEGAWGSGKTTTIGLLRKRLTEQGTSNARIISFDAWVHQGDPLRRAFLFTLIDQLLAEADWCSIVSNNRKHWQSKKDELSRRVVRTSKRTFPGLTPVGKGVVGWLITLPLAIPLATDGARLLAIRPIQELMSEGLLMYLALTTASLVWGLVPLIYLARQKIAHAIGMSKFGDAELFSLLLNKTTTEETSESSESPEPTSIEFQDVFGELLKDALVGDRRLVLCIDNLDRLRPFEVEAVWSLLRSFLDNSALQSQSWYEKLWVIVPIAAMPTLPLGAMPNQATDDSEVPDRRSSVSELASRERLLEKVFQLRFHLPPPPTANWRKFALERFREAFPDMHAQQVDEIVYFYEYSFVGRTGFPIRIPTPREIKSFVNDLVVLVAQWGGSFTPGELAAYLLDTTPEGNHLDALQERRIPSPLFAMALGEDLADSYAAIHFGTSDKKIGGELLRRPLILEGLIGGKADLVTRELRGSAAHFDYLTHVLTEERVLWDVSSSKVGMFGTLVTLASVLGSLEESNELPALTAEGKARLYRTIQKSIRSRLERLSSLDLHVKQCQRGLIGLIQISKYLQGTQPTGAGLVLAILNVAGVQHATIEEREGLTLEEWCDGAVRVLRALKESSDVLESHKLKLPLDSHGWLELCRVANGQDAGWIADCTTVRAPDSMLIETLKRAATDGDFHAGCCLAIGGLDASVRSEVALISLQRISAGTTISTSQLRWTVGSVSASDHYRELIEQCFTSGGLHKLAFEASESIDHEFSASALLLMLIARKQISDRPNQFPAHGKEGFNYLRTVWASGENQELATALADQIIEFNLFGEFLEWVLAAGNPMELAIATLKNNTLLETIATALSEDEMFSHRANVLQKAISSAKSEGGYGVVASIVDHWRNAEASVLLSRQLSNPIESAWIFSELKESDEAFFDQFAEFNRERLRALKSQDWILDWNLGGEVSTSLLVSEGNKAKISLGHELRQAILAEAKNQQNENSVRQQALFAGLSTQLLTDVEKVTLLDEIFELVAAAPVEPSDAFWNQFGALFQEAAIELQKRGERVAQRAVEPIIQRKNPASMVLIPPILLACPKDVFTNQQAKFDDLARLCRGIIAESPGSEAERLAGSILEAIENLTAAAR